MSLSAPFISGFLLGLATGPLCMLTCIPLALPFALGREGHASRLQSWDFVLKFLAGRLLAYATIGLLAGFAATQLGPQQRRAALLVDIAFSIALIAWGLGQRFPELSLCRLAGRLVKSAWFPFALGAFAGVNICPPFLLAIAFTLDHTSHALAGLAFFLAFFAATTLFVLPLGFFGYLPQKPFFQRAGRLAAIVAGAAFLALGVVKLTAL